MRNIVVMASTLKIAQFFMRLAPSLNQLGFRVIFFTLEFSAYYYLKRRKGEVYTPHDANPYSYNTSGFEIDFNKSIDVLSGKMNVNEASSLYTKTYKVISNIYEREERNIDGIFLWNGLSVEQQAATHFANKHNIRKLYFELSNIDGKIFADPWGTNATSKLYHHGSLLEKYKIDDMEYVKWREKYIREKRQNGLVPQRRKRFSDISVKTFLDGFGYLVYIRSGYSINYLKRRIKILLQNCKSMYKYDHVSYQNIQDKFIFFPLQVSYDTQVLINSDISLSEALDYAIKKAQSKKMILVVKPHPQEVDSWVLKKLYDLKKQSNILIVNDNTFSIIPYAFEVITINSTVGLEAKILGKKTTVLGRAFFKNFTQEDLKRYIMGYLINIDFFNKNTDIDIDQVHRLIKRLMSDE